MFFSHRTRSGRDRFLPLKTVTLVVGGLLGLGGMRLGSTLLIGLAIVVVSVGFLLRFVRPADAADAADDTKDPLSPP